MVKLYPLLVILLLLAAAYSDLKERKIRNWKSVALLICFLSYAAFFPTHVNFIEHILWAVPVFLVFLAGFLFGKIGGGDVKLATVSMIWAGPENGLLFLTVMAFSGGALGLFSILPLFKYFWADLQVRIGRNQCLTAHEAMESVPYGVAIALGGSIAVANGYLAAP
ncbi:prepilin peptidase [Sneathiella marina]|uniref:Prepilin peptidase n=1 Tax=Sneathiella marina TaxID=2950108 RepID=A0ABY4WCQ3_9PROT|nr:prepilin peptidase [Sneathiella marina]USG63034.1 prepilin peptidase [Sneathiella marina]